MMRVGVQVTVDGRPGRQVAWFRDLVQTVEGLGFDSLWFGDHVVEFAEYSSRHPYRDSGRHPSTDRGTPGRYEPLMALSAAAAWTSSLRLGTAVLLLTERNPVLTAAMVATLDHLAGGRIDLGVGVGWLREEHEALGVPFEERGRRCDEYLEVMRRLWTEEVTSYEGDFVSLSDVLAYPKPLSDPHPPLLIGGVSDAALRRVARRGNGWLPVFLEGDDLRQRLADLYAVVQDAGRLREDLVVMPMYVFDVADVNEQQRKAERHLDECVQLDLDGVIFKPRIDETTYETVLIGLAQLLA